MASSPAQRSLSDRADLDQLRRQAKELLRDARAGETEAVARIGAVSSTLALSTAQLALAREYGFPSWSRLKAEVERRRFIERGDVEALAGLVAAEPELAREAVRSCITAPGQTALTYVAMGRFSGRFDHDRAGELTRVLIAAGAPVDGNPGDGETPLITATCYGEPEMVAALIEAGADLEATGLAVPGGTALDHAIEMGMTESVDVLVAAGAAVTSLYRAAARGDLTGFSLDESTEEERARGLYAAAICERLGVIDELLAAGTRVDAEVEGATALHNAARLGRARSVAHLLAQGADPNRLDFEYQSAPLGWCWHHHQGWGPAPGCTEVERLLAPLTDGEWVHEMVRAHRAEPADAPAIAAVLSKAHAEHRKQLGETAYASMALDASAVAARFEEGPVWIAVRDDDVIGSLSAVPDGAAVQLRDLAVEAASRGAGVGELLLTRAGEWALPAGFEKLRIDIPQPLEAARRLCASRGFVTTAETETRQDDVAVTTFVRDIREFRGSNQ
jgi:GNAT superfamily N-acetyltransferase